jgi:DNA modification methylase
LGVRNPEGVGHNSGEDDLFRLEKFLSDQEIQSWPVNRLRASGRNLRVHSPRKLAALKRAVASFKFFAPLVIDPAGNLLAGHARLAVALDLGFREVPVIVVSHLTDAEKRLYELADNRIAELSTWNMPALTLEIVELSLPELGLDLSITGFDTPDTDRILNPAAAETDDRDDVIPALNEAATSRLGDLWLLGRHRLYCGSALEQASYDALLAGERAQMVISDPPYNVAIAGHVRNSKTSHREFVQASGEMSEQEFTAFLGRFLKRLKAVTDDGAIIYVFMDHAHSLELQAAAYPIFGKQKNLCVWVKDSAGMGSFYRSQHELIYIFKNGMVPHINNFNLGEKGRYRTNVWNYPGVNTSPERRASLGMHPTVKPCSMFVDAILDCSNRGGIILDCFGGSGVTVLAAERTGRIARVIELDPLYADLIIRRWQLATGGTAIHTESGGSYDELASNGAGER